jgi:arsenite-transporting ATPase
VRVTEFLDSSLSKIIRLRKKLDSASNAVKGLFGAAEDQDAMVTKLEGMQAKIQMVQALFKNKEEMEFVIATIPTQLAISESSRLLTSLRTSEIPCKRIVVNQVGLVPRPLCLAPSISIDYQSFGNLRLIFSYG